MIMGNKPIRLLLGSGVLLLLLWFGLLLFTSQQDFEGGRAYESETEAQFSKPAKRSSRRNRPRMELPLDDYVITQEQREQARKNDIMAKRTLQIDKVNTYIMEPYLWQQRSNITLVFLHGAAFSASTWAHKGMLQLMAELGYKTLAIDLPGYGETTFQRGTKGKTVSGHGELLAISKVKYMTLLMSKLNLTRVLMIAPSMSGLFALPYIVKEPSIFAGFLPVAPAGTGIIPQNKLENVQVPTLLVYGDRDEDLGPKSARDMQIMPRLQIAVIPRAGHAAYLDQPEDFQRILYNFAQQLDKS